MKNPAAVVFVLTTLIASPAYAANYTAKIEELVDGQPVDTVTAECSSSQTCWIPYEVVYQGKPTKVMFAWRLRGQHVDVELDGALNTPLMMRPFGTRFEFKPGASETFEYRPREFLKPSGPLVGTFRVTVQ